MKITIGFKISDCYFDRDFEVRDLDHAKATLIEYFQKELQDYNLCEECLKLKSVENIYVNQTNVICSDCLKNKLK